MKAVNERAEEFIQKLGGDEAIKIIYEKVVEFLVSKREDRNSLIADIPTYELNDFAKQYLHARFEDLDPIG